MFLHCFHRPDDECSKMWLGLHQLHATAAGAADVHTFLAFCSTQLSRTRQGALFGFIHLFLVPSSTHGERSSTRARTGMRRQECSEGGSPRTQLQQTTQVLQQRAQEKQVCVGGWGEAQGLSAFSLRLEPPAHAAQRRARHQQHCAAAPQHHGLLFLCQRFRCCRAVRGLLHCNEATRVCWGERQASCRQEPHKHTRTRAQTVTHTPTCRQQHSLKHSLEPERRVLLLQLQGGGGG